jgi:hypothetical protein
MPVKLGMLFVSSKMKGINNRNINNNNNNNNNNNMKMNQNLKGSFLSISELNKPKSGCSSCGH